MADYVQVFSLGENVEVLLNAEHEKILVLGEKMNAVCEDAYMNGYNWEALLQYYLEKNDPDILADMKTDPEAGMYVAYWPLSPENEARANRLGEIIRFLVEQEDMLCRFVQEEGGSVEWD
ncbi:MAG: hypothetical protein HFF50_05285 [Lawsonibacter sp.]|nr:hypothetical protein [Lawsonibacter sp.]